MGIDGPGDIVSICSDAYPPYLLISNEMALEVWGRHVDVQYVTGIRPSGLKEPWGRAKDPVQFRTNWHYSIDGYKKPGEAAVLHEHFNKDSWRNIS